MSSFLLFVVACLVGQATLTSAQYSITGISLPSLPLSEFGSAYKDPCKESWSNDERPDYPCPTASPTSAPTINWDDATMITKFDMCRTVRPIEVNRAPAGLKETKVTFYYTVETTPEGDKEKFLPELENALLQGAAEDLFLPCDDDRKLQEQRGNLRQRKLQDVFISSISSRPVDTEMTQFSCTPEVAGNKCYVFKGEMATLHDKNNDPADVESAVLSSVEKQMSSGELTSIDTVEKVTYLGSTLDNVADALGPVETKIPYYYKVEATSEGDPDEFLAEIESSLNKGVADDVTGTLSGIGAVSSDPADTEMTEFSCIPEVAGNKCYVVKGALTVLHDEGIDPVDLDVEAAVLSSVEGTMASGELTSIDTVEKVTYLGSTLDNVIDVLGPVETKVPYYYKVEATSEGDPDEFLAELESSLNKGVADDVTGTLSGIGAVSSDPADTEMTEFSCIPEVAGNKCYVVKGEMTVLHDEGIDPVDLDVEAAVLSSIEGTMTSGELTSIDTVEKVTYLGSTLDNVTDALGPVETKVPYYYKVEATSESDPDEFLAEIESSLNKGVADDVTGTLSGISAVSSDPADTEMTEFSCIPEVAGNKCYVVKGGMTVLHDEGIDPVDLDVEAAVLSSVEKQMSSGELISIDTVEKVTYLGSTLDNVTDALGPVETKVPYYYKVEATSEGDPDEFLAELESSLNKGVADDVTGTLSGIGAVSSDPADTEMTEFSCIPEVAGNKCYVVKGALTVLHDEGIDPVDLDVEAAVLSSVERTMASGELTSIDTVEKVTYLGSTLDNVTDALGPVETKVPYYYKVEATSEGDPDEFLAEIESSLNKGVADDVTGTLSGIGAVSSDPADTEMTEFSCIPEVAGNKCYVVKGALTVLHDEGIDPVDLDVEAAVLSSVEGTMASGELTSIDTVEKVTYLGSTLDNVIDVLGPVETKVPYYYKVEATSEGDPDEFLAELESSLNKGVADDVTGTLSGIGAVSSDPADTEMTEFSCIPEVAGNKCYVVKGEMTVLHDEGIDPVDLDVEAAVLSSVEGTMASGELTSIDTVEKVTYLGSTLDNITDALGPVETKVPYYYKVEATSEGDPDEFLAEIESSLNKGVADDVTGTLSGISAVSSDPADTEMTEFSCIPEVAGNKCYVVKGALTVLHDEGIDPVDLDVEAAVLSSVERTMASGELTSIDTVEKVTYLGSTLDNVTDALGPVETKVPYYYKVEATSEGDPDEFLAEIESSLNKGVADDVTGTLSGIGAVSSDPADTEMTEFSCTPEVAGNKCYVVKGEMTVLHDEGIDPVDLDVEAAVLSSVEGTMTSGELTSIDTVEKVTYLGTTLDDVEGALGVGAGDVGQISKIIDGTEGSDPPAKSDDNLGTIVGVSIAAALIILLALLLRRSRRRSEEDMAFKGGLELDEMNSFEDGELDENVNRMLSGADYDAEPGSFHLGQFHYTRDGVRYLSPTCSLCAANGGLATIPEDGSFCRADANNLGKKHSALDVHNCSSSTCQRCQNGSPGNVAFIKTGSATFCQPIDENSDDIGDQTKEEEVEKPRKSKMAFWKK